MPFKTKNLVVTGNLTTNEGTIDASKLSAGKINAIASGIEALEVSNTPEVMNPQTEQVETIDYKAATSSEINTMDDEVKPYNTKVEDKLRTSAYFNDLSLGG